jgi:hypothetical protein
MLQHERTDEVDYYCGCSYLVNFSFAQISNATFLCVEDLGTVMHILKHFGGLACMHCRTAMNVLTTSQLSNLGGEHVAYSQQLSSTKQSQTRL